MRDVVNAVSEIAALDPPRLPAIDLPTVPDVSAAAKLAPMIGGSAGPILQAAANLTSDRSALRALIGKAS